MLKINGTDISLTRGDTAYLNVSVFYENGNEYLLSAQDELTLTLRKTADAPLILIEKKLAGAQEFHFEPADTKSLRRGDYVYDVQLKTAHGDIYTIIGMSRFEITPEISV